jgi:hypothetical protein
MRAEQINPERVRNIYREQARSRGGGDSHLNAAVLVVEKETS